MAMFRNSLQAACLALIFTAGYGPAWAQESDTENDTPAVFADHDPSLKNSPQYPSALTTAGAADPGPVLDQSHMTAAMLAGQGPGCTVTSPCAAVSPPPQRAAHSDTRRNGVKDKS
jgi:hypothetical protein